MQLRYTPEKHRVSWTAGSRPELIIGPANRRLFPSDVLPPQDEFREHSRYLKRSNPLGSSSFTAGPICLWGSHATWKKPPAGHVPGRGVTSGSAFGGVRALHEAL